MTYPFAPYHLHQPTKVDDVLKTMEAHPGARLLAGGTDLMVNMRRRLAEPEHVISLARVEELRGVSKADGGISIGAMTTLEEIAGHDLITQNLPVLAQAAGLVAGPTLRAMGTLGGNVLLDTRCRYYNQSLFWRQANDYCLKKDGEVCHVAPGGKFCWAAFSADTPAALLVLKAEAEVVSTGGSRRVPLNEIYGTDGRWSVGGAKGGLAPDELLTRLHIPMPEKKLSTTYEKLRVRDSIDFPLAGVALAVSLDGKKVSEVRLALTGLNPRPVLLEGLDDLAGRPLDVSLVSDLAKRANRAAKPMRTTTADPAYRRAMVSALVERAVGTLDPALAKTLDEQARWA